MYPFTSVSEESKSDFFAPGEELYSLFEWTEAGVVCHVEAGWTGTLEVDGATYQLADLMAKNNFVNDTNRYRLTIHAGSRILIQAGELCYVAQLVPASERLSAGFGAEVDYPFLAVLLAGFRDNVLRPCPKFTTRLKTTFANWLV